MPSFPLYFGAYYQSRNHHCRPTNRDCSNPFAVYKYDWSSVNVVEGKELSVDINVSDGSGSDNAKNECIKPVVQLMTKDSDCKS